MKTLDIYSVGNALMDILVQVDESLLGKLGLSKGTMNLIDEITLNKIHTLLKDKSSTNVPAGACVNTVVGVASLGGSSAFTGHLGNDDHSLHFERDLCSEGVKAHLHKSSSENTGQVYCLITPDGERTMATYLGASIRLENHHVNADLVKTSKILYLTGYELESGTIREAALCAIEAAKDSGTLVAVDLADSHLIHRCKDQLRSLIKDHVDICFANESEAEAFTGKPAKEAIAELANLCDIAVVKVGAKGSFIHSRGSTRFIDAVPTTAVDTTGAGDLYASGFLYGLSKGYPLELCGKIASALASRVVSRIGARVGKEHSQEVLSQVLNEHPFTQ